MFEVPAKACGRLTMPAHPISSAAFAIANMVSKPIRSDKISSATAGVRLTGEWRANVVVIDHEQASLHQIPITLRSIGIDAIHFQDGRIAMQEIDGHRPNVLLFDLMTPA